LLNSSSCIYPQLLYLISSANFLIAICAAIIFYSLDAVYPPITVYTSVTVYASVIVCPLIVISSTIITISYFMVNKLQGKQILALYILAKSQWITFQYSTDYHIVIQ